MDRMIFVNLPVADLAASRDFYTGLGFTINEMFSDDQVTSIVISDTIVVMLLARERFSDFARVPIADARATVQVLNALSASSREEVDALFGDALAHGGAEYRETQEEGPMYGRAVTDPDGHVWEFIHMDMSAVG
ncbi:VOC family protein [Cellulomonas cellasea]|uniref:VOC family protein n=1 Tax=Cellulomonas cellasea TaxID=43670 RepID=UPI0025A34F8D|nr:VOC family protein [Cellulomonas cellasea]MDM8084912.1 VOC family protein [Cellulomonas cellasea]